jgi:hypothetical protein
MAVSDSSPAKLDSAAFDVLQSARLRGSMLEHHTATTQRGSDA